MSNQLFNQKFFNSLVLGQELVGFAEKSIPLKSGRSSPYYVNWRRGTENAVTMDLLTDQIIYFTRQLGLNPDCFYGVPEGATPVGLLTQFKWALRSGNPEKYSLAMGRGKAKEHGASKDRYFIGEPRGKVVVIEDVTTTGDSLLKTLDSLDCLRDQGVEVIAALGLTNRNETRDDGKTVEQVLQERGVRYHALSNARELLPLAFQRQRPSYRVARAVERYFDQYGTAPLSLLERIELMKLEQLAREKL
ncbi:hypothetical protein HYX12_04100, partial [Candidatus Woesearchaeota archaeon]|nr:hypothetical protein [Candidatus Woesearchaeota archaeon]